MIWYKAYNTGLEIIENKIIKMAKKTFRNFIKSYNPCTDAWIWIGDMTIEEIVETCYRGDWLLWLAKKVDVPLKELTLTKGYCANTVIKLMKDERSINAVKIAISFGKGLSTRDQLNAADAAAAAAYAAAYADADAAAAAYADAAYDAAYADAAAAYDAAYADAAAAYDAANAAAAAAYAAAAAAAAYDAAAAAYDAANADAAAAAAYDAAAAAAAAAYAAAAADAKKKNLLKTANICRKYIGKIIIDNVNQLLK
jgi:hypothetical protein